MSDADFVLNEGPYFVPRLPRQGGRGVDFLGLRAVNLALITHGLPGFINATDELRLYSLISWAAWRFYTAAVANEVVPSAATQRAWFDKVELLYNWSHQLHDDADGLPGNQQKVPPGEGRVPLSFAAWKRNVSLLDPASYGPTLRTSTGLGFIEPTLEGLMRVTQRGEALGHAFDAALKAAPGYAALANVTATTASAQEAAAVYPYWRRNAITSAEQAEFRVAFFNPARTGEATLSEDSAPIERRSASVALLLAVLRANPGLDAIGVRREMAWGAPLAPNTPSLNVLERMRVHWQAVQVRQAQRLALEALLGFVEEELSALRAHDSETLAQRLVNAVSSADLPAARFAAPVPATMAARCAEGVALLAATDALAKAASAPLTKRAGMPQLALQLFSDAARLVYALNTDPALHWALARPGSGACSLLDAATLAYDHRTSSPHVFLRTLIEEKVITQHLRVAVSRTDFGKQRLRLGLEETGLATLIAPSEVLRPFLSGDRIRAALTLLTHAGVLTCDAAECYYVA